MRLRELEKFEKITIQCHDNPDADSIASAYGLLLYFQEKKKEVEIIYGGRNQITKTNLVLMLDKLNIPIRYRAFDGEKIEGLLITVDCQYGAGNVTRFEADEIAIIDHHQQEIYGYKLEEINASYGSCSTIVWRLLLEENYPINDNLLLGTALYYGLYTDTSQFSELFFPLDIDMREQICVTKSLITLFRNSNLTMSELEIAGIALIRYIYNDDYRYAIIKSQPCDPNILGIISDFLLQVDNVDVCVVYNESSAGFKLSVRSCVKEVNASELSSFLTEKIGSGGGHIDKAGGFINRNLYEQFYPTLHSEGYISKRMNEYFDNCIILEAKNFVVDTTNLPMYIKKKIPIWFVKISEALEIGTPITVRTLEGDVDMVVSEDIYIMIGIKGEVYPIKKEVFENRYHIIPEVYELVTEYTPTVKDRCSGRTEVLIDHAKCCIPKGESRVHVKELHKTVKIFTQWDEEKYMLGRPGDYMVVSSEDIHDIYVVEKNIFQKTYEKC